MALLELECDPGAEIGGLWFAVALEDQVDMAVLHEFLGVALRQCNVAGSSAKGRDQCHGKTL